ncbi:hypothetical protein [Modestobacter versicolor]|uniref:Uncharacterized protein n=1 Tax=Modestobacter versicolor TaxID=429133 RepID=A0A323V9U6_9ACTN|nr:hypothetical protein [Modestobacter versicolor]MBB3676803.1 hypothetical protein [Modestobacter versicolor]PZA21401.1 hypothetical protein DMO24_10530 [Modestobacter versicolor]
MSILSKLMGTAQQTAGRGRRVGGRPATGRRTTGTGRTAGGTARMARGTTSRGRAGAPAAGGLGKLLSSFAKRR